MHMTTENQPLSTLREIYDDIELAILFDWLKIARPAALQAIDLDATRQHVRPEEASGPMRYESKRPENSSASDQQAGILRQSVKALRSRGHSCNTWIPRLNPGKQTEVAGYRRDRWKRLIGVEHDESDIVIRPGISPADETDLIAPSNHFAFMILRIARAHIVQFSIASSLVSPPTRMQ